MAVPVRQLAKIAISLAKNPEKTKKHVVSILITVAIIFTLPAIMLMTISAFFGENKVVTTDMPIANTKIYNDVMPLYMKHVANITAEMEQVAQQIITDNTYTKEVICDVVMPDGSITKEYTTEDVCDVSVYVNVSHAGLSILLAYITITDVQPDETIVNDFYSQICMITSEQEGDYYYVNNTYKNVTDVANQYFADTSDQQFYEVAVYNYAEFLKDIELADASIFAGGAGIEYTAVKKYAANGMKIPLYLQGDMQWGNLAYGGGTISTSGCGPTCIAMVYTYLLNKALLPTDIIAWSGNRFYTSGVGSSWSIFRASAANWGLHCTDLGQSTELLVQALENGNPVISSMRPGTFTKSGHFIVLRGITEDGKILVNDPNDSPEKNHLEKEFPIDLILRESKNFWCFYN